jgi:hypothetical protein
MPELEVPAAGRRGGGGSNPSRRGGEPEQLSSAGSVRGVGKKNRRTEALQHNGWHGG